MPVTGIFFLPSTTGSISADNSPLQQILGRLKAQYTVNPLGRWTLDHRLFRGALLEGSPQDSVQDDNSRAQSSRYLQVLSLSTHPRHSYVAITTTSAPSQTRAETPAVSSSIGEISGEPANIIAIPSGPQCEDFIQLVVARMSSLWTPRQVVQVSQGQAFEVGDFRVRVGDVKQGYGGAQQIKGTLVEVEWLSGDESDWSIAEDVIKSFWTSLDIKGSREITKAPGLEDGFGNVRQWCEALRLRT